MKPIAIIITAFLLVCGCSKDIPEPEVHDQKNENIDPIQMEYKLYEPHVKNDFRSISIFVHHIE